MKSVAVSAPLAAFFTLGLLSGWFVGASNSPIAGTLLSSVFTFSGLVLTVVLGLKQAKDKAVPNLQSLTPLLTIISGAVILFSVGSWLGVQAGVRTETHTYPSFVELLKAADIENDKLSTENRWRMLSISEGPIEHSDYRVS